MIPIKMVDLNRQHLKIRDELNLAIQSVLDQTNFILGDQVREFEKKLSTYLGCNHVISCANGTDALQVALMALDLPRGAEILVPTFSYVAAAEVIALLGFVPVFVEAEESTFNIDPKKIEERITEKTKAIIPVHLFGQSCDLLAILKIAQKYNLIVIEDNAQSIGCQYIFPDGVKKSTGTIGHIGTTSFFPSKNLGCMGDGGAIFCNDAEMTSVLKKIANHGQKVKYEHEVVGINSRLDTLQASVLLIKLKNLDRYIEARQKSAAFYDEQFKNLDGFVTPVRTNQSNHVFHQYTLKVKHGKRDQLKAYLEGLSIPSMMYYPIPLHLQKAFSHFGGKQGDFPVAEQLCNEVLSLPMHSELDEEQLDYICKAIRQF